MIVTWTDRALDRLADVYTALQLPEQKRLAVEVERINEQLATEPWFLGESREPPTRRMWYTGSLAVTFELRPNGRVVVLFVSPVRRRPDGG